MIKKTRYTLFFLVFSLFAFGQSPLDVGTPAPAITITSWLENIPEEQDLTGKYLIVDFWATWCGPCIKAVPHMNELKREFGERDDVLFLAISDETPEKIRKTLKRINFDAAVVTDQEGGTQNRFQVESIPITYLIDSEGIIRWVGTPDQLELSTVGAFLDGTLAVPSRNGSVRIQISTVNDNGQATVAVKKEKGIADALKRVGNKDLQYVLELETTNQEKKESMGMLPVATFQYGSTLAEIFASFLEVPPAKISVPEALQSQKYSLTYIQKSNIGKDKEEVQEDLIATLLKVLDMTLSEEIIAEPGFIVRVIDENKLEPSVEEFAAVSDAGDQVIFTNQSLANVLKELGERMDVIFLAEKELKGSYDWILEVGSMEELEKSMKDAGLSLQAKEAKEKRFRLERQ